MKTATKSFPAFSLVIDPVTQAVYRSQYDIFTIGAGYLDVLAALSDNSRPAGSARSPLAVRDSSGAVRIVPDAGSAWAQSFAGSLPLIWGHCVFTPESLSTGASAAWGSSAAWGASAAWGHSATWSASAAWGHSAAWGNSVALGEL